MSIVLGLLAILFAIVMLTCVEYESPVLALLCAVLAVVCFCSALKVAFQEKEKEYTQQVNSCRAVAILETNPVTYMFDPRIGICYAEKNEIPCKKIEGLMSPELKKCLKY
jgi:hypothetical protein